MEEYRDTGNKCKRRPYTYNTFYISQIIYIRSNGNAERQDSDKTLQKLSGPQKEALLGKPFLESGILCKLYRFKWEQDKKVCKISRKRKKEESDQQEFGLF